MTKPNKFILSTDYATLQNNNKGSFSFTTPASLVITVYTAYTTEVTYDIPSANGAITTFMLKHPLIDGWIPFGRFDSLFLNGNDSIIGAVTYPIFFTSRRKSSSQVSVSYTIFNYGPGTLTTEGVTRNIDISVRTFIPPFA